MIMAFIGFAVTVLASILLIIVGVQVTFAMVAFTGKYSGVGVAFLAAGIALAVLAFKLAPFTISFGVSL